MFLFVNWCNENQGFLTFLLSAFTILLSIIAIIVSINTARLPYKKRVLLNIEYKYALLTNSDEMAPYQLRLSIINIGNSPIGIKSLALGFKKNGRMQKLTLIDGSNFESTILEISNKAIYDYPYDRIGNYLISQINDVNSYIKANTTLYITAYTFDGHLYKKKFNTVYDLIDTFR